MSIRRDNKTYGSGSANIQKSIAMHWNKGKWGQ